MQQYHLHMHIHTHMYIRAYDWRDVARTLYQHIYYRSLYIQQYNIFRNSSGLFLRLPRERVQGNVMNVFAFVHSNGNGWNVFKNTYVPLSFVCLKLRMVIMSRCNCTISYIHTNKVHPMCQRVWHVKYIQMLFINTYIHTYVSLNTCIY